MASTNKTTHYELSQYVGTDKPTYLTDYNQDMSRIDAGIYGAKALADVNESAIGTLTNLTTTAKTDLVSAINELDGEVTANTANISTNTSNISTNATNIGNLNNLTTASKTNLVSAINEVDANSDSNTSAIGDLTNLTTTAKTNLVSAVNEVDSLIKLFNLSNITEIDNYTSDNGTVASNNKLSIATNSDSSIFKLYGELRIFPTSVGEVHISFATSLRPTAQYTIKTIGIGESYTTPYSASVSGTVATDGTVTLSYYALDTQQNRLFLPPCLYFNTDFGDTPSPQ